MLAAHVPERPAPCDRCCAKAVSLDLVVGLAARMQKETAQSKPRPVTSQVLQEHCLCASGSLRAVYAVERHALLELKEHRTLECRELFAWDLDGYTCRDLGHVPSKETSVGMDECASAMFLRAERYIRDFPNQTP